MKSPITLNENDAFFEKEIEASWIINKYKSDLDLDVSQYFQGIEKVQIYTCTGSSYQFYYPFSLVGDGGFYENLQKLDWYYMPWKWEHRKAKEYLSRNMIILEVGCANGGFLSEIKPKVKGTVGLELNQKAIEDAKAKGLEIYADTIQEHAQYKSEYYDFVCSFQVLEHISDVHSFITAQLKCLKKGGLLWISVPNRDSFPKQDWKNDLLNFPPHHMGLWNEESLRNLEKFFPIKLKEILFEPLQPYHQNWYQQITEKSRISNRLKSFIYYHLGGRERYRRYIEKNANHIKGHTIAAVFYKL